MPDRRSRRRRRKRLNWGWIALAILLISILLAYNFGWLGGQFGSPFALRRSSVLIDPNQKAVLAGESGWQYSRSLDADLDADGTTETIEVIARVTKAVGSQEYQWDDGQPWQVYIRDGQAITRIYSRFVQLGQLQVFTTAEAKPRLAIVESQGAGYALYAISYSGPGKVYVTQLANLSVQNSVW